MKLHNGTGCLVHLIGTLFIMPDEPKNSASKTTIIINRKRLSSKNKTDKLENYRVILNTHDAQRILKFGFPGMLIEVHGDLLSDDSAEIIADKIDFMNFSNGNQSQTLTKNMNLADFEGKEKSYWFTYHGMLREELMYIH